MIKGKAVIITGGLLHDIHAKTAHGLLRSGERFEIVSVIDHVNAGKSVKKLLADDQLKDVEIFADFRDFGKSNIEADFAIIGVATKGGVIPESLREIIVDAIQSGLSIINGLHEHLSDINELVSLSKEKGVELIDIRKPKPFRELNFWSGKITDVKAKKIAVLGTDCALGKRTTTRFLTDALNETNKKAEMIFTGQTGWLQGGKYGFIFDATLNDFISGEIEKSIIDCYENERPDYIIIEGQSALRNPSGPCGSEFIVSGDLDGVILQHAPKRDKYKDLDYHAVIPPLSEEIKMIKMYGAPTIGVCLNTQGINENEAREIANSYEDELNIPVILPLFDGMNRLVEALEKI